MSQWQAGVALPIHDLHMVKPPASSAPPLFDNSLTIGTDAPWWNILPSSMTICTHLRRWPTVPRTFPRIHIYICPAHVSIFDFRGCRFWRTFMVTPEMPRNAQKPYLRLRCTARVSFFHMAMCHTRHVKASEVEVSMHGPPH
jgi:hypothetical protein